MSILSKCYCPKIINEENYSFSESGDYRVDGGVSNDHDQQHLYVIMHCHLFLFYVRKPTSSGVAEGGQRWQRPPTKLSKRCWWKKLSEFLKFVGSETILRRLSVFCIKT